MVGQQTMKINTKDKQTRWIISGFMLIIAYFLWSEHHAHVFEYLPLGLLLACVGMHFFMHRGGHGHGAQTQDKGRETDPLNSEGSKSDQS